jgi:FkbM family methyltransferase
LEIIKLLSRKGKRLQQTTYLDIGAHHPVLGSNTYKLYSSGSHGVLVEPNPDLIPELKRQRPNDVVLNIGASDGADSLTFYRFWEDVSNTFSIKHRDLYIANGCRLRDSIQVDVKPVMELVECYLGPNGPDVLSVDAEGYDYRILSSWDWMRYRPSVVITEIYLWGTTEERIFDLMAEKGYRKHKQAMNNWIFYDGLSGPAHSSAFCL